MSKEKGGLFAKEVPSEEKLEQLREANNPNNEPTGHFTGRCMHCGSRDLWDDNLTYGCDCCGAIFILN